MTFIRIILSLFGRYTYLPILYAAREYAVSEDPPLDTLPSDVVSILVEYYDDWWLIEAIACCINI